MFILYFYKHCLFFFTSLIISSKQSHFMLPVKKGTECKGSSKKKIMSWKAHKHLTNMCHKTDSDVAKKVMPASKTNQGQSSFLLWKMRFCLKWLNNSQAQAELRPSQSVINWHLLAFWTDAEMLEIQNR